MFEANWLKTTPLQGIEVFIFQVIHVHVPSISQVTTTMCISNASRDKSTKHGIDKWGKKISMTSNVTFINWDKRKV